jgi:hypothetical protein
MLQNNIREIYSLKEDIFWLILFIVVDIILFFNKFPFDNTILIVLCSTILGFHIRGLMSRIKE